MDKEHFLQLDSRLKSEISDGLKLDEQGIFEPIIHQISFRSCLILGMRSVAYRNKLFDQYRDERDEYFTSIESILGVIYANFSRIPFEEKVKAFSSTKFAPKTSKERFEAMKRIENLLPKLKTSWIEKC